MTYISKLSKVFELYEQASDGRKKSGKRVGKSRSYKCRTEPGLLAGRSYSMIQASYDQASYIIYRSRSQMIRGCSCHLIGCERQAPSAIELLDYADAVTLSNAALIARLYDFDITILHILIQLSSPALRLYKSKDPSLLEMLGSTVIC